MASYPGSGSWQSEVEHGRLSDDNWSDVLCEDVNYDVEEPLGHDSDDFELLYKAGHSRQYGSAYPGTSYCTRPAASAFKSEDDDGDEGEDVDNDDDDHIHRWCSAGRTLQPCLSRTSETSQLCGNDNTLIASTDIPCGQELACPSVPGACFHSQFNSTIDLCSSDCQGLPGKSRVGGCSSLPASGLLALDDDPQKSFLPLFSKLRQKVSCLDSGCQEELPPTSRQRGSDKSTGHGKPSQLSTWSDLSSSDESGNHWFHSTPRHSHRHSSGIRRPKSDGKRAENWWARSFSEEPECYATDKVPINHHSSTKRRQKKSSAEKNRKSSLLLDSKRPSVVQLPLQTSLTRERANCFRDWTSFADCLADVESSGTDSDSVGRLIGDADDDEDFEYDKTVMTDDASSSVVAPLACSFHCIPPKSSEKQNLTFNASRCSPVCDKYDKYTDVSSEGELSASLAGIHISDHDSCRSSCSFGGILHILLLFICKLF